ncbi:PcfJ-like protein [Lachnospiraceae bacterium NK3A20]|nr:PcfJ-like protein [Lachnospiraceae bacterium NK3A20]
MKKKDLLTYIPNRLDKSQIRLAGSKKAPVLVTVLPQDHEVHFTWGDGYLTYNTQEGTWRRATIYDYWGEALESDAPKDEKARDDLRKFEKHVLGDQRSFYTNLFDEIKNIEYEIWLRKQAKAQQRKKERIRKFMEIVPPMPKHFRDWAEKRYRGRADKYSRIHNISLCQQLPDGWIVERIFRVEFKRLRDQKDGMSLTEIVRGWSRDLAVYYWDDWYYGEHWDKVGVHQSWWDKKTIQDRTSTRTDFYDGNLEDLGIDRQGREIISAITEPIERHQLMRIVNGTDELKDTTELLAKMGFSKCLAEYINASGPLGVESLAAILKDLGGQQAKRLAKLHVNRMMISVIDIFPKATDETLLGIGVVKDDIAKEYIMQILQKGLNANHVWTLMQGTREKGMRLQDQLREYIDYLDMAEKRGCDIHSEIIYRNKRWKHFHDQYVEELNREKEEQRTKKFQGIKKDLARNRKLFGWQQGEYFIRPAESADDIIREGRLQHHCVGASDTYMLRMTTRESWIVFLRRTSDPDTPYYTIEVDRGRVIQAYAAYDRKPDWDTVNQILREWMRQVKKNFVKMDVEERQNAAQSTERPMLEAAG